jgi:hypothetical protein
MPEFINATNITPPRVPLIDQRTGLISREWYRFFLNLFNLTGGGTNQTSLVDLQLGPPPVVGEDIGGIVIDIEALKQQPTQESALEQIAEINKQLEALASSPDPGIQEVVAQVQKQIQTLEMTPRPELGSMAPLQQDNVPWLTFNIAPSPVPTAVGSMYWDGGSTLGIQATANVLIKVGESEYVYVKASSAITKGQLCYHTGAVGASGVITAAPTPLGLTDPNQIVGVAAETIALNGFGLIQISGDLRGFNTTGSSVGETWADGDPLYYNPNFVGSMTKVKPTAPSIKSYIGEVINAASAGSGSMHIRIVPGSVLGGTDSNVQFGTLANSDLIQYDSTLQYWKNVAPSSIVIGTATNIAGGAAGSVPYQSAPSTTTFLPIGTALQVLKVNSGATAPEWVSGAALTKTDDTNVTLTLGGTPTTSLLAATSLTLGWTGQLAVSRGGTGLSSGTSGGIPYFSSTTAIASSALLTQYGVVYGGGAGGSPVATAAGTTGQVLTATTGGAPSWAAPAYTGTVTSVSVVSANGFAGTVATATTTPAITLSTSITGLLYGNGTAIAAATVSSPLSYSAGTLSIPVATSSANGYLSSTDWTTFNNKQSTSAPVTYTANFSVATTDNWIINNKSGSSCTATLPTASSYSGRVLHFQNYQAQTLVSASSNVVPVAGGAASTSILLASAGDQCTLVSDGTNWIMTQYIPNNALLLE